MSESQTPTAGAVAASLANERTHLAWQRTAMSWGAAGAVVTRYFATDGIVRAPTVVGMLMLIVGASMWLDGERRYRRADAAIRAEEPVPVPVGTLRVAWTVTVVVVAVAIAVELTD